MLNDEKQKKELISIDYQLKEINNEITKAEMAGNYYHVVKLKIQRSELLSERAALIAQWEWAIDREIARYNTEPSAQNKIEPSQFLIQLASFLFPKEMRETALGDLEERFHNNCAVSGKTKAQFCLLGDVIESAYDTLKNFETIAAGVIYCSTVIFLIFFLLMILTLVIFLFNSIIVLTDTTKIKWLFFVE